MPISIHPTAIVHPGAELGQDVYVGPFCLVEEGARLGDGCRLNAYVHICSGATLGQCNIVHSHACLGDSPQHLGYKGEPTTLVIGDRNEIREFVTMHRGTPQGHGETLVGSENLFMAYAHVAHDCRIGSHNIVANAVNLAGHVEIGNYVVVSGMAAVEQFLRIGDYAFLGGASGYNLDIPPYMLAHGVRGKLFGPNVIGLRRRGFTKEAIQALRKAYKIIFRSALSREEALKRVDAEFPGVPEVVVLTDFIRASERGVAPDYHKNGNSNGDGDA